MGHKIAQWICVFTFPLMAVFIFFLGAVYFLSGRHRNKEYHSKFKLT